MSNQNNQNNRTNYLNIHRDNVITELKEHDIGNIIPMINVTPPPPPIYHAMKNIWKSSNTTAILCVVTSKIPFLNILYLWLWTIWTIIYTVKIVYATRGKEFNSSEFTRDLNRLHERCRLLSRRKVHDCARIYWTSKCIIIVKIVFQCENLLVIKGNFFFSRFYSNTVTNLNFE